MSAKMRSYFGPRISLVKASSCSETMVHKSKRRNVRASYTRDFCQLSQQNNRLIAEVVRGCAAEVVGEEHVCEPEPAMVGEDMAYYLEKSAGCFFLLGAGNKGQPQLHSQNFNFNEKVLPLGVELFCRCALRLLEQKP